jgi:hypothetical protein
MINPVMQMLAASQLKLKIFEQNSTDGVFNFVVQSKWAMECANLNHWRNL